jgi:alpha-beta hydrolase superfamily lysophospholipase
MRTAFLAVVLAVTAGGAQAQTEKVVEIPSRGTKVRALLSVPPNPVASVVLLAGGHGVLAISFDGKIGWGAGNQLVRTRAAYAKAGFATIVPDAAADMGTPQAPKNGYRWSAEHGRDIGAVVAYMRTIKEPVAFVGTSRGAVTAGTTLANATGAGRPDMMVLTAPMLMPSGNQPSFQQAIGSSPAKAQLPFFVVGHRKDSCAYTLPASIEAFRKWHGGKLDVTLLDGPEGKGDPCEAYAAHGFFGIDGEVVSTVSAWIKARAGGK